ncbi:HNH endonuclease [Pseudonocardiaceae bacterium YIM PH 21723]|nr:HNH endonuclease [Pseudonocardiaceae bacterium YIM PH 21723]
MKRTGLHRRSPLRATGQLQRHTSLSPARPVEDAVADVQRIPLRRHVHLRRCTSRIPRQLRAAVYDRAEGTCDMCGRWLQPDLWEANHRLMRSQGGRDALINLVALHPACHRGPQGVHHRPAWAYANGLLVPARRDPQQWPVLRHGLIWQMPLGRTWADCDPHPDQLERLADLDEDGDAA